MTRLDRIIALLICPACHGELVTSAQMLQCKDCQAVYPVRNGKIYFIEAPQPQDGLDSLKGKLKKWLGRYYYTIGVTIIAPTYPFSFLEEVLKYVTPEHQLVVDVGCGNNRLHSDII